MAEDLIADVRRSPPPGDRLFSACALCRYLGAADLGYTRGKVEPGRETEGYVATFHEFACAA